MASFGLLVAVPTASHAAPAQPTVAISASEAADGDQVAVELSGWTPGILVSVAVCGTGAGSVGCADHFAAQAVPGQQGSADLQLIVVEPPAPCPCVVQALSVDGGAVSTPIAISGTTSAPLDQTTQIVPEPRLEASVRVVGSPALREQFGLGGQREVVVRVANVSSAPSEPGELDIVLGRNSRSGDVAASFTLPVLAPGEVFEDPERTGGARAVPAGLLRA